MVLVECEFNWKAVGIVLQSFSCAVISCFCARARAHLNVLKAIASHELVSRFQRVIRIQAESSLPLKAVAD